MTVDTYLETLTRELRDFCRAEGLPFESADDLARNPDVTPRQHHWLLDFCTRWDAQASLENDSTTLWSVQRRDTNEYWCRVAWGTTPEWFGVARRDEICRAWKGLPLALSSRRNDPTDDEG